MSNSSPNTGESPDLIVEKASTLPDAKDGYTPGTFTFIPECEMQPELSSWLNSFDNCVKNPGHLQFHTIYEFLKDPESILRRVHPREETHRNKILQTVLDFVCYPIKTWKRLRSDESEQHDRVVDTAKDVVRFFSKLTTKVKSTHTSKDRPACFPGTDGKYPYYGAKDPVKRYSTGFLVSCFVPQEGDCMCADCRQSESKQQKYWLCIALTATHGVFNKAEAEHSTFDFYDIDKVIEDQVMKDENNDKAGGEVKDRKKVMMEWEKVMDERKMMIDGTGIAVNDFETRYKDYVDSLRAQSDDVKKTLWEVEDGQRLVSILRHQSNHPLAGDMNVVVCVTHDPAIATRLGTAWTDWRRYENSNMASIQDMSQHYTLMTSFPHGAPMMVSMGGEVKGEDVRLFEVMTFDNVFLEKCHSEYRAKSWYNVKAYTGNSLVPDECYFYPPRGLGLKDVTADKDSLVLPARTKVVTWLPDEDGYNRTQWSLRKTTAIPIDYVTACIQYRNFTHKIPTCPGSSGALVWNGKSYGSYRYMTHSGAIGDENENTTGIDIIF